MSRANHSITLYWCSFQRSVQNITAVLLISEHSKIWGYFRITQRGEYFFSLIVSHSFDAKWPRLGCWVGIKRICLKCCRGGVRGSNIYAQWKKNSFPSSVQTGQALFWKARLIYRKKILYSMYKLEMILLSQVTDGYKFTFTLVQATFTLTTTASLSFSLLRHHHHSRDMASEVWMQENPSQTEQPKLNTEQTPRERISQVSGNRHFLEQVSQESEAS